MNIYMYQTDLYCEDCGKRWRTALDKQCCGVANPDHESSYDSNEYPKGPYPNGGGAADAPQHCACGSECLNVLTIYKDIKVGAWLENPLTLVGVEYVKQSSGAVAAVWKEMYRDVLSEYDTDEIEDDEFDDEKYGEHTDDSRFTEKKYSVVDVLNMLMGGEQHTFPHFLKDCMENPRSEYFRHYALCRLAANL